MNHTLPSTIFLAIGYTGDCDELAENILMSSFDKNMVEAYIAAHPPIVAAWHKGHKKLLQLEAQWRTAYDLQHPMPKFSDPDYQKWVDNYTVAQQKNREQTLKELGLDMTFYWQDTNVSYRIQEVSFMEPTHL